MERSHTSNEFCDRYSIRDKSLKKKLRYFPVENISEPCLVTIAVNPKEYFEFFKRQLVNKKHKGLNKGAPGMEFEDWAKRINSVKEIETFRQLPKEKQKQGRFLVKNNEIVLEEIEKSKLAQINDKRYYFSDDIVSLPFSHPVLMDINKFKREK